MSSLELTNAVPADVDQQETQEWLDALEAVLDREGAERHFLIESLIDEARRNGAYIPYSPNTAYVNTIPPGLEPAYPGNLVLEERIRSYIRWNAMAMVVRANKHTPADGGSLGGHIASFASAGHSWWNADRTISGMRNRPNTAVIWLFFQGYVFSPGMYSRAFLEGRLTEENLNVIPRQDVGGEGQGPDLLSAFQDHAEFLAVSRRCPWVVGPLIGHLPGSAS
ncbi:Pyruvate dehydrogenase E1 component [Streptomyces xanthochromogenes]